MTGRISGFNPHGDQVRMTKKSVSIVPRPSLAISSRRLGPTSAFAYLRDPDQMTIAPVDFEAGKFAVIPVKNTSFNHKRRILNATLHDIEKELETIDFLFQEITPQAPYKDDFQKHSFKPAQLTQLQILDSVSEWLSMSSFDIHCAENFIEEQNLEGITDEVAMLFQNNQKKLRQLGSIHQQLMKKFNKFFKMSQNKEEAVPEEPVPAQELVEDDHLMNLALQWEFGDFLDLEQSKMNETHGAKMRQLNRAMEGQSALIEKLTENLTNKSLKIQVDFDRDSVDGDSLSSSHLLRKQGILTAYEEEEDMEALRRQLYKCQQKAIELTKQNQTLEESKKELFVKNNEKDEIIQNLKSKILQNELVDKSEIEKLLVVMPSKPVIPLPPAPPVHPPPPSPVSSPTLILYVDSSEKDEIGVSAASASSRTQQASKTSKTQSRRSIRRAAEEGDGTDGVKRVSTTAERPDARLTRRGISRFSRNKNIVRSVKHTGVKSFTPRETGKADRSVSSTREPIHESDATIRSILRATVSKSLFESSVKDKRASTEDFAKAGLTAPHTTPALAMSLGDLTDRAGEEAKAVASRRSKEIQQGKALKSMVSSEDESDRQVKSVAPKSSKNAKQGKIMKSTALSKDFKKSSAPRRLKDAEADETAELTASSKGVAKPAEPRSSKEIEAGKAVELTATSESFDATAATESDRGRSSVAARKSRVPQTGKMAASTKAAESGRKVKSAVPRSSTEIQLKTTMKFKSFSEKAGTEDSVGSQVSLKTVTDESVNLAALTKHFDKTEPEKPEKSAIESDSIKSEPDRKDRRVVFAVLGKVTALEAEKLSGVVDEDLWPELEGNLSRDGEFETVKESRKGSDAVHGKDVQPEGKISPDFVKRPSEEYATETGDLATQLSTGDSGEEASFEEYESFSKLGTWAELQEIEGDNQLNQQREVTERFHKLGITRDGARDSRSEVRQSTTRLSLEFVDGQSEFGQGAFRPVSASVARLCTRGGLGLPLGKLAHKSFTPDSVDLKPHLSCLDTIEGVQGRTVVGLQRECEKQRAMSISTSSLKTGQAFRTSEQRSSVDEAGEGHGVVSHSEECLLLRGIGLPSRPSLLRGLVRTADVLRGPLDPEFNRGGRQGLLHEDLEFKRASKGLYPMEHFPGNTELRSNSLSALPHKTLQLATGKLLPLQPMTPDYMASLKFLRVVGSTLTTVPCASSDTQMLESAGEYHPPMTSETWEAISSILRAYNIDLNDPATLERQLESIKMSGSMSGLKEAIELLAPYVKPLSEDVEFEEKTLLTEAVQTLQKRFAELVTQGLQTGFQPVSIELPVLSSKVSTDRQRKINRSNVRRIPSTQHQARGLVQLRPILDCEAEFIRYRKILEENADLQVKDRGHCPSYKAYVQYRQSLSQATLQHLTMDSLTRRICYRPLTD